MKYVLKHRDVEAPDNSIDREIFEFNTSSQCIAWCNVLLDKPKSTLTILIDDIKDVPLILLTHFIEEGKITINTL